MINLILHVSDGSNMASTIASWFSDEINFRDLTMEAVRLHQKSDLFNFLKGYMKFPRSIGQLRPYLPENTRSRSIPEVKLVRALLVLRLVTMNISNGRSGWRYSLFDFQPETAPSEINILIWADPG